MKHFLWILSMSIVFIHSHAQILSGPMLGNNTMKEVTIWIQTEEAAAVKMYYHPKGKKDLIKETPTYYTKALNGNTAHLVARNLEFGTTYEYFFLIDRMQISDPSYEFTTQEFWQYRKPPPAFSFALGSCLHTNEASHDRAGEPYGDTSTAIFPSILKQKPDFMLWLGDNIYLRSPDFDSHSGIYHRYTHYKSQPYLQELWSSMHHYAIWDDHDYGPNDSDRSYIFKNLTRKAFMDFWSNPTYGQKEEGIYTAFRWADCYFILLDNRFFRTPNALKEEGRTLLGKQQLQWLKDQLITAKASYIFVAIGGQFLNPSAIYENSATYEEEREEILNFIKDNQIENVIFLSGDRHRTELSKLSIEGMPTVYDFTCSPLSSHTYKERAPENNSYRIEGTQVVDRNFGMIYLEGDFGARKLTMKSFDKFGNEIWTHTIDQ